LIVPAKAAWPDYNNLQGYFCQPDRSFKRVAHIGFYHHNKIEPVFPRVLGVIDNIVLDQYSEEELEKYLEKPKKESEEENLFEYIDSMREDEKKLREELVDRLKLLKGDDRFFHKHRNHKIFILSEPNDERTIKRDSCIKNDKLSRNGTRTAFVQMQRYLWVHGLRDKSVQKTSQLEKQEQEADNA